MSQMWWGSDLSSLVAAHIQFCNLWYALLLNSEWEKCISDISDQLSAVVARLPWDRTVVNKSDAGCVKSITSPNCHRHPLFIFYMHPHANLSKLSLSLSASLLFHGFIWLLSKLGQFSFHLIFWRPFNWCLGTPSRRHRHSNGRSFQPPWKVFKHCKNCRCCPVSIFIIVRSLWLSEMYLYSQKSWLLRVSTICPN